MPLPYVLRILVIAIGGGSDIAIEAADMVLLESFSSVVEAVRFGRMMFGNLKKTIAYLLPAGSFSEFWPVMTKRSLWSAAESEQFPHDHHLVSWLPPPLPPPLGPFSQHNCRSQ